MGEYSDADFVQDTFLQRRESVNTDRLPIHLDRDRIAEFSRKWKITELWLFGSVLTDRFGPDSDVDFLATYAPDASWSLLDIVRAEMELKGIVGRDVDLIERTAVEKSGNWIRRRLILDAARPFYVA